MIGLSAIVIGIVLINRLIQDNDNFLAYLGMGLIVGGVIYMLYDFGEQQSTWEKQKRYLLDMIQWEYQEKNRKITEEKENGE